MKEEKKSSKEILSELFDKFNATPPSSPSVRSVNNDDEPVVKKEFKKKKRKSDKDRSKKKRKKDKKSKKKHEKSKKPKRKKRRRSKSSSGSSSSDDSASDSEKKTKLKKSRDSDRDLTLKNIKKENREKLVECKSNSPETSLKIKSETSKLNDIKADCSGNESKVKFISDGSESNCVVEKEETVIVLPDVVPTCNETIVKSPRPVGEEGNPLLEPEPLPQVADIFVEELLESAFAAKAISGPDKPKVNIKISDLKKSNILELAEQKLKEKAEKYEEGELSSSSEDAEALPSVLPVDSDVEDKAEPETKVEKVKKCSRRKAHKSSHRKKSKSRSGSRGKKGVQSKEQHRHKRNHSGSRERSRSRGRKRRSDSHDKKKEERHKKSHRDRSSHKKKERKDVKADRDKKDAEKKIEKKDIEKKEDKEKRKHSHERRSRSRERDRRRNKSKSPLQLPSMILQENPNKKRRRSRSRTRGLEIDKKKLLEIARKNALSMLKQTGVAVPTVADPAKVTTTITAGGKTVDELTDFCKQLSQKEGKDDNIELSPISDSSEDENEKAFHHPFQIKDRPSNIVMNIRNCTALPVKTHQEKTAENAQQLRLQFPVSSGQQHRKTESEWVPVEPKKDEPAAMKQTKPAVKAPAATLPVTPVDPIPKNIDPPPLPPSELVSVFPSVEEPMNINIGDVVGQKLAAIKRLHDNPADYPAQNLLRDAEDKLARWNESNQLQQPGLFTGSTGARLLTPAELASGQQAWAKKDQLMCAQPVTEGIGKSLLEKMGWRPGEGLGKNHEGTLEPLSLPLKMDKRGLVCAEEVKRPPRFLSGHNPRNMRKLNVKSLEGKHPVSLLLEYCSKRHFNPPIFNVCLESGPSHKKMFLFKVEVNGIEYQPPGPSNNKKQAKSEAALVCLRALGVMPSTSVPSTPS